MAAAARVANCVPSNVVARIKELESDLGQDLFVRDKGKVSETPFGRIFYREAKELLQNADRLNGFLGSNKNRGLLRIGALDVALLDYLPRRVASYLSEHPGVEMSLLRRPSFTLERMLDEKDIDLALTDGPIQHPLLQSRPAYQEELYLAVSSSRPSVDDALSGSTAFLFNDDCLYREHFEAWLKGRGVTTTRMLTIESYEVIAECVHAGLGISCFPGSIAKRFDHPESGVKLVRLHDLNPSQVYFVWRRNAQTDLLMNFIDHLDAC